MNPPIKIDVRTDNLHQCFMRISGADSETPLVIEVPSSGNVYQALHHVAPSLERFCNDLLASHGITPPEPSEEITSPGVDSSEGAEPTSNDP